MRQSLTVFLACISVEGLTNDFIVEAGEISLPIRTAGSGSETSLVE